MKHSILALSLLILSLNAVADLGRDIHKKCESPEIKTLTGASGSCRTVVASKSVTKSGACSGTFLGSLVCTISYFSMLNNADINLSCYSGTENVVNESMSAEAVGFSSAMIIRKANGQNVVINNPEEITHISNSMVSLLLTEEVVNGQKKETPKITITLDSGTFPVTNVICR